MAYVFVQIEPAQIGATDAENFLQEAEEQAAADVQTIVANAQKEAQGYQVAEMAAEQSMEVPTIPLKEKTPTAYYLAGGLGLLLLITLISK